MTVIAVGEISLGSGIPMVSGAYATALADIEAKIEAMASFRPVVSLPGLDIEVCAQTLLNLKANLALGIVPASITLQVDLALAALAALKAQLKLLLELNDVLGVSAHLYSYTGPTSDFGTELDAELAAGLPGGAPGDTAQAVVFIATAPAAVAALLALFKTSP